MDDEPDKVYINGERRINCEKKEYRTTGELIKNHAQHELEPGNRLGLPKGKRGKK